MKKNRCQLSIEKNACKLLWKKSLENFHKGINHIYKNANVLG